MWAKCLFVKSRKKKQKLSTTGHKITAINKKLCASCPQMVLRPSWPTLSRSTKKNSKQINIINHSLMSFLFSMLIMSWVILYEQAERLERFSKSWVFLSRVSLFDMFVQISFNYFHCLFSVLLFNLFKVMLYVDGMNGLMEHGPTIQWLYSLIASKYRLVVKTALKLLLVFVEYSESNCYQLVNAIRVVDNAAGTMPWINIMK